MPIALALRSLSEKSHKFKATLGKMKERRKREEKEGGREGKTKQDKTGLGKAHIPKTYSGALCYALLGNDSQPNTC